MKSAKNLIAGFALITGLIGLAAPASAAWYHDRDFSRDHRELADARQELRHDVRRGAGRYEIAQDGAASARERRENVSPTGGPVRESIVHGNGHKSSHPCDPLLILILLVIDFGPITSTMTVTSTASST